MTPKREDIPVRVVKPWGHEVWWAWTDEYVGKILHVKAGHKLSLQYHEIKDETCYVLRGRLLLHKGETAETLTATEVSEGDQWRNLPGEVHTIEALDDSDVLEASTPHLDDVVRIQDNYGREGTNSP